MDGAEVQAKVWRGYGIAASKVGLPHTLYRPDGPAQPLRLLHRVTVLPAILDAKPSYGFRSPAGYGNALRFALVDGRQVRAGDYLVGPAETAFIAAMPPLQPIVCVACNATLDWRRLAPPAGFGVLPERTDAAGGEAPLAAGWPASLLYISRGGGDGVQLPGDATPPLFAILLPPVPGLALPRAGDVLTDAGGQRYAVVWGESSHLGWRLHAQRLVTG